MAAPAVHTLTKPPPPYTSRYVAVIGAGAAGLVAVRELRREDVEWGYIREKP
ncbi:hypothetical protein CRG98_009685 [Punica granatum]|uniref:Uncharacterized protein n=1 Tax=Punica granatum TaxID=22663 RepID=A0A2I0KNA8_PUNGR|nr:hypothetical protein CRG98_009685 [Punica granatum]